MADAKVKEDDLYKAVVKRSSADLITELGVAFPHETALKRIHGLTRDELLDAVIHTRTRLNSLSVVRQVVNGEEKPPELFSIVGDTPAGGVTISELSKTVTVVTNVTSTKPVLVYPCRYNGYTDCYNAPDCV